MGKIILKIPKRIKLEYQISDNAEVEKLIKKFERIKSKSARSKKDIVDIVGIWKDRFPTNKSSIDIAKELRKKAWTRS